MWANGRASNLQKLREIVQSALKLGCSYSSIEESQLVLKLSNKTLLETLTKSNSNSNPLIRSFLSQASSRTGDPDDDNKDLFAELDIPLNTPPMKNEDSFSEVDHPDQEEPSLCKAFDGDQRKRAVPELYSLVKSSSINASLLQWVADGNELERKSIDAVFKLLLRRKNLDKSLQLSNFLESYEGYTFTVVDYTRHLHILSKVKGIVAAQKYFEQVPPQFQTEPLYRTMLTACVTACNLKKSEEVFNKMKDLEFPLTTFCLNQLLLLYKRLNKTKIADVLLLMEKLKLQPDQYTLGILIAVKGASKDIAGMEQVIETMKNIGLEPDTWGRTLIANYYIGAGKHEKAESLVREVEGELGNKEEKRFLLHRIINLYGRLGKSDDVARVWRVCEASPLPEEYSAAILAYGRVKNIEAAEKIFETLSSNWKQFSDNNYLALLRVYRENRCYEKGKMLIKTMEENGVSFNQNAVDLVVGFFVDAGELDVAETVLLGKRVKPMFRTFMSLMNAYALKGDVFKAENIFSRMRECGYVARANQFSTLLLAYLKAKTPAYGIKERMKADNIFPDKEMASHIADVDPFSKATTKH